MNSTRVLMPTNSNRSDCFDNISNIKSSILLTSYSSSKLSKDTSKEKSILRRPGVPVTTIQSDWICKRISHFTVNTEAQLIGFGLYNVCQNRETVNIEVSIGEFKTGKTLFRAMVTLQPTKHSSAIQRALFNSPVPLKPGRLYEAMAYYHQLVPLYLKSDPFESVQSVATHYGELTCEFRQMLPKGRYRAECYPSEIPELIFS